MKVLFLSRKAKLVVIKVNILIIMLLSLALVPGDNISNYSQGHNGMVTTANPYATQAGYDMLKAGGNAVDAAVAAAFAIGVVEPDGSGIGGGGGMVIYLKDQEKSIFINYYQEASQDIDDHDYENERDRKSPTAILIPGTVAGLTKALEEYGTLPLETVLQPAIRYAREGVPIDRTLASLIIDNIELLQKYESTSSIYLVDDFPLMEGDTLKQLDLSRLLSAIARDGRSAFYNSKFTEAMVKDIAEAGGMVTLSDMQEYNVRVSEPISGNYRGFNIISADIPQSGASIIEALNILENKNIKSMGHFATNSSTLHFLAETFRKVYADRAAYMGDPDFEYVPINGLISKKYGQVRFNDIDENYATPREYRKTEVGNPYAYDSEYERDDATYNTTQEKVFFNDEDNDDGYAAPSNYNNQLFDNWGRVKKNKKNVNKTIIKEIDSVKAKKTDIFEKEYDGGHTTHLSVIDKDGNVVSLTQTLGTFFGSGFTSQGVLFNSSMSNYSTLMEINKVKPGKRPRSSISPTIILKDGNPFLVVGSPGASRIISTVVQLIVNTIDFDMNVVEANNSPRIFCQKFDDYLYVESRISKDVVEELKRKGHNVRVLGDYDLFFGGAQMILIDWENHKYFGSADLRRGGSALGL